MQAGVGLLDSNVMPVFMIIALDIFITLRFSINCSAVICSPTVIFSILREASSETYGPRVYFPSYKFPIYNISFQSTIFAIFYFPIYKPKIPKIFTLLFIYLYQISLLQVTVKGLTTPLSRWVQVVWLFVQVLGDLCVVSYWIDTLVLKLREILISTLLHHPFLFKGKTNASSRSSTHQWHIGGERWCLVVYDTVGGGGRSGATSRPSNQEPS